MALFRNRDNTHRTKQESAPLLWGALVFTLQFLVVLTWELIEWHRFALTWDYSLYNQTTYLISHGVWNPYVTFRHFYFYQNDMELFIWVLGLLQRIIPIPWFLILAQSTAIGLADWIAYLWILDIARESPAMESRRQVMLFFALASLLFSPWLYWAISFDVHTEVLIMPLIVGLARELWRGRIKNVVMLTILSLLGGTVALTYVAAIGLSGVFRGGRSRRIGIAIIVISVITLIAMEHVPGGLKGVSLAGLYGYLEPGSKTQLTGIGSLAKALLLHPLLALQTLVSSRRNLFASLSAEGVIGVLNPTTSIVGLMVLIENGLIPGGFWSSPQAFQSVPVILFTAVGTVAIMLQWVSRLKSRVLWNIVIGLLCVNMLGWAATWIPPIPGHWIRISPEATTQLHSVLSRTPKNSEVATSQGFAGRFSGRRWFYIWWSLRTSHTSDTSYYVLPIRARHIILIVSPYQGVELSTVTEELARIKYISSLPDVKILSSRAGIWAFNWTAPILNTTLKVPLSLAKYPAWALSTQEGARILEGPSSTWHMASTPGSGYVVDKFYKRLRRGTYNATAKVFNAKPVILEVWNATTNQLLLRRWLPPSLAPKIVSYKFSDHSYTLPSVYHGWGPFKLSPASPPPEDKLELKVWTPKNNNAGVYWVNIINSISKHS